MDHLKNLIISNTQQLAEDIRFKAEANGNAQDTGIPEAVWGESVRLISEAMVQTLELYGYDYDATAEEPSEVSSVNRFAEIFARAHYDKGVSLVRYLTTLRLYRRAYRRRICDSIADEDEKRKVRSFFRSFFDGLEIMHSIQWARFAEEDRVQRMQENNQLLTKERSRFLSLFNGLPSPVLLLSSDLQIELINPATQKLMENENIPESLTYAQPGTGLEQAAPASEKVPLQKVIPWLANSIQASCSLNPEQNCRFDSEVMINGKEHHFDIAISYVDASPGGHNGITVVVDDVTARIEAKQLISKERNRAENYLDFVGTIVLALDPSGSVMMANRTACATMGYEKAELLGHDWFDICIPAHERDAVRDYFTLILQEMVDVDEESSNQVITKDGEHRIVTWRNRLLRNDDGIPIGVISSGMDITEHRKMEEALEEKELWLRNTFVALGEGVLILTPDRHILDANPAAESIFQMSNDELTGIHIDELHVSPEMSKEYGEITRLAFERGESAHFEFTLRRKNGESFPAENSVSLISSDEGTPLGVVNTIRDISNRKKAEQVLRRSEEKFRRIFETIVEGFIVTGMDGIIQMVNPATCNLLGFKEHELVGHDIAQLFSDDDERQRLKQAMTQHERVQGIHLSTRHKSGDPIVLEANAHFVRDEGGEPVAMEGTFRDITARLEAEKVLREREKQYRAFFENNHAIMLLVDPKTDEIVDANPAASEFYGYPVSQMRTMNMRQLSSQSDEDIYQEMFRSRQESRVYFIFQHRLANHEIRDVEVYSGPIMVQGTQLLYSVIHDVTERIRLEKEMKRMATTDALTGANNRRRFFELGNHELKRSARYKHPLAVVMLDIDYFKSINDNYGHQAGDEVLIAFTSTAKASLRDSDIFGRLGGEEFAAVLTETSADAAIEVAERLLKDLAAVRVPVKGEEISFTVSIGVSFAKETDSSIEMVLNRADEALYKAKRGGRNRVVTS